MTMDTPIWIHKFDDSEISKGDFPPNQLIFQLTSQPKGSILGVSSSSSHAGGTSRQLGGGEAQEQSSQPATTWPGRL